MRGGIARRRPMPIADAALLKRVRTSMPVRARPMGRRACMPSCGQQERGTAASGLPG